VDPDLARSLFREAARKGIPCLIDSRHRLREFGGASLAAPNEPEVEELAGCSLGGDPRALARAGRQLMAEIGLDALVVTQGGDGMTVFRAGEKPAKVPIFGTDEVADVTGAGDTVAAALALSLAAGADALDAARLATVAAGLVVMKQGTSTVTAEEVRRALSG
jgi:rfaE bifunctional protein kinase chain/domain